MAADDGYERYYTEKIWQMIPEVYHTEDGGGTDGDPMRQIDVLRQIVTVIAGQAAITRRSIDRLWEDQNVETSDDWAVPYIGDLVANRPLTALDTRARRVDVAETIHFRRRRGTPSLLEELVRELSGWDVVLVEAFKRLARACHRLDAFPTALGRVTNTPVAGTADLRNARASELVPGPFDEFFHTPDYRRLNGQNGRFNIRKVNFHIFRLQPFEMLNVTPAQLGDPGPVTFTFDPSGRDVPLFSQGQAPEDGALQACGPPWDTLPTSTAASSSSSNCEERCATLLEWEVTKPIPCRLLGEARFVVTPADVVEALKHSSDPIVDKAALDAIVGLFFPNEARLRERLIDLGVNFSNNQEPAWYRGLLEAAVTADSAKPHLYGTDGSIKVEFEKQDEIKEDAVTAADLSSRILHPIPSDPGARVLIDPELGRFAPPQPRGPVPPPPPPPVIPPLPDQSLPPVVTTTPLPTTTVTPSPPVPTPSNIESDSSVPPEPESPPEPTPTVTTTPTATATPTPTATATATATVTPSPTVTATATTTPSPTVTATTTPSPTVTTAPLPPTIAEVALFAQGGQLSIGDRRQVQTPSGLGGTIINAGNGATNIGTDGVTGNIWTVGSVSIGDRTHVKGFVRTTAQSIGQGNNVIIDNIGNTQAKLPSLPLDAVLAPLNFTVAFPPPQRDVNLAANSGVTQLSPGSYGQVTVGSNATLALSAGFYFFNSLNMPAATNLSLDTSGGVIELYVSNNFTFQARQVSGGGDLGQFRLIYTGTQNISIDVPPQATFTGIVLALGAQLNLEQADVFSGAFFAKTLFVQPDASVVPISWNGVLSAPGVTRPPAANIRAASVMSAPAKRRTRTSAARVARAVQQTGDTFTITIAIPEETDINQVALHTDGGTLVVNDNAQLLGAVTGFAVLVNASTSATQIDAAVAGPTDVGNVFSVGNTTVGANVHVHGFVRTSGTLDTTGATVDVPSTPVASIPLRVDLTLEVDFPTTKLPDVTVSNPTDTKTLEPGGAYVNVTVSAGVLEVPTGKFFIDALTVSAGATLRIRASHGPVEIYVRNTLSLAPGIEAVAAGNGSQIRIAYFGATTLALTAPLAGTVMAPSAKLELHPGAAGSEFVGAFFAQSMQVFADVTVRVQPFFIPPVPLVDRYVYGFSGPVGAGPYPRTLPVPEPALPPVTGGGVLPELSSLDPADPVLTIGDSLTYTLAIPSTPPLQSPSIVLQSNEGERPYVLVSGDAATVNDPATAASLTTAVLSNDAKPNQIQIDGIWFASADDNGVGDFVIERAAAAGVQTGLDWDQIIIRHCTFDPGGKRADKSTIIPLRLLVAGRVRQLIITRSILGAIAVQPADDKHPGGLIEELIIVDSIVDASHAQPTGNPLRQVAIDDIDGKVTLRGVTVFGDIRAGVLDATDTLVDGQLIVANTQDSCFRFSAASPGPSTRPMPKLFNAVVDQEIETFFFTSKVFGNPGYAQLSRVAPPAIAAGAENASEMGAFSFLLSPIHLASIIAKVDEFGPLGLLAQYILEDEAPIASQTNT
jgi:hypothetical protein